MAAAGDWANLYDGEDRGRLFIFPLLSSSASDRITCPISVKEAVSAAEIQLKKSCSKRVRDGLIISSKSYSRVVLPEANGRATAEQIENLFVNCSLVR